MFFNLGLTADAAAAHRHEFSSPQTAPQSSSATSPSSNSIISFAALPAGLSASSTTLKQPKEMRSEGVGPTRVSSPPASVYPSSDDEEPAESAQIRSRPVRKQSHRPKTSFQLAHPVAHACHKRLRLRPRLLLQVQQISQTSRPIPTLDVLPSTIYVPLLARRFPTIFRGKDGLGPNDLIVVASDSYDPQRSGEEERSMSSEDERDEHREVIATICQILKGDAWQKGKAEICLNYGPVWEATPLPNGSYEFVADTGKGIQKVRWVLRGKNSRRSSTPAGTSPLDEDKRFTFSVIDPNTRRHPVIASMTRNNIDVYHRYSLPPASSSDTPTSQMPPMSPMSTMSTMSLASGFTEAGDSTGQNVRETDDKLRTLIVITGIWVAFREGWSKNFTYNDSTSAGGHSTTSLPISSKQNSFATASAEKDAFTADRSARSRIRRASSVLHRSQTPSPADNVNSSATRTLSKRHSTGAAFMERVNRQRSCSATGGRLHRHSMFSGPGELATNGIHSSDLASLRESQPGSGDDHAKTRSGIPAGNTTGFEVSNTATGQNSQQSRGQSTETSQDKATNEPSRPRTAEQVPVKTRRWRRLTNIFDFVGRKNGIH